jgi:hypothetical protein
VGGLRTKASLQLCISCIAGSVKNSGILRMANLWCIIGMDTCYEDCTIKRWRWRAVSIQILVPHEKWEVSGLGAFILAISSTGG